MVKWIRRFLMIFFLLGFSATGFAGQVDIGSSADSQVVEGYPTSNSGSKTSMYLGAGSSTYGAERIYVKFELDGELPAGVTITSATLLLYCYGADSSTSADATAHAVEGEWTEDAITWDAQPTYSSTAISTQTLNAGDDYRWYTWDVTSHVQTEYADDGVVSVMVKLGNEAPGTSVSFVFDGKEYSSSLAPRLRIEYEGEWSTANSFKIFHVNDVHSRLVPHDVDFPGQDDFPVLEKAGGAAYMAAKMIALKDADPTSLVLDAGDISEGSPLGDLDGNRGMLLFYSSLDTQLKALGGRGIDAIVVGNHDVRYMSYLTNMTNSGLPIISMNICKEGTTTPYFSAYKVVTLENGVKVGILGYTTDTSSHLGETTEGVIDVVTAVWDDDDTSTINIKDYVKELREDQECDVVVLLSHIGQTRIVSGSDALIEDSGGVDPPEVVVSGHWHTWDEKAWQPAQLNYKTTMVEAASYMQYIGELEVTGEGRYVDATKHPVRCSEITPNTAVQTIIDGLVSDYNNTTPAPAYALDQVIGYSAVDLLMDKDKWWTVSEYPWNATNAVGAWITDAMVWYMEQNEIDADLAIQSGGSIRRDVPKGPITYNEIYEAYPWSDNIMVQVEMTGQQIWDFIQSDYCGTSISAGWKVTAQDGAISSITYNGTEIGKTATFKVIISDYMAEHESDISFSNEVETALDIRQAVIDYTAQYTKESPMYANGIEDRYDLDTELAGGFRAVVLFVADTGSQPYHEDGFIRLLSATDDTLLRRGKYGLSDLVNSDGSINKEHQFSDTMLYRGFLGFLDGKYQHGDIIEIWGEGGFYEGAPEFISEEGIVSDGVEIEIVGHDETLARPETMPSFASFWDEWHENHYVKLYVKKTGDNSVVDADGDTRTIYQGDAYYTKTLPGEVGDILELTGVQTVEDYTDRRFRCHTAAIASDQDITGYPAASSVDAISTSTTTESSITLTATASDTSGEGSGTVVVTASADTQVAEGHPAYTYGSATNLYLQSYNSGYENERIWVKFDLDGKVPAGATVTSATLSLYQWWTYNQGGDMAASVHGCTDDTWTESALDWDGQPAYEETAEDEVTLVEGSAKWYEWRVASFVQSQVTREDDILSFVLKPSVESSATKLVYNFDAREYSTSYAPSLEVSYEVEAGSGEDVAPAKVAFYYRYSADGVTWGDWTLIGEDTDSSGGWSMAFDYDVDGDEAGDWGYFEFYSIATDADENVEDAPVKADASVRYISGSNTAAAVTPASSIANGTAGVDSNVWLTVDVADNDGDAVDVCFYAEGGTLIDCVENVASGTSASVAWTGLSEAAIYSWYTVATDGTEESTSALSTFTTANSTPSVDSGSAAPGTTSATLTVTVSDADDQTLDVFFYDGESKDLIDSQTGIASGGSASVVWDGLTAGTEKSWYVKVTDGIEEVVSDTWTFITGSSDSTPVPAMNFVGGLVTALALILIGVLMMVRRKNA